MTPTLFHISVIMTDVHEDRFMIYVFKILARTSFVLDHRKSVAKISHPHMYLACMHAMENLKIEEPGFSILKTP